MLTLPAEFASAILTFAPVFSKRVWAHAQTLLLGAILAPAQRTVAAVLRIMGLASEQHFGNYHRVLNRDRWSPLSAARLLLGQLIGNFVTSGVVLVALDDTLERRRGAKISAKGIYRDPVRSSHSHFVKASGLRWLCVSLLAEVPISPRRWALPILTLLAPSERYNREHNRRHKKLTDWAAQALHVLHHWLPGRQIIAVVDSTFAALEFLDAVRSDATVITRLRLDAALFAPPPPRKPGQRGRPPHKGKRLMKLEEMLKDRRRRWQPLRLKHWYQQSDRVVEILTGTALWGQAGKPVVPIRWVLVRDPEGKFRPQAFLSTDPALSAQQILEYYVERWQVEVTFEETRQYLGVETQRQWSDPAIARTTPCLMALYSLVTLMASQLLSSQQISRRTAAWYVKEQTTFSDALAAVRRTLWQSTVPGSFAFLSESPHNNDNIIIPRAVFERFIETVCYGS